MKTGFVAAAGLIIATLGASSGASAQSWGPPPPPPGYGYGYGPPPGPPPIPGPHVVQKWQWGQPGYHGYHPRCWTEYRNNGWEMVKVCQ